MSEVEWEPITPVGEALMQEIVARQYNRITKKYGAGSIPIPHKPHPNTRYELLTAGAVMRARPLRWRVKGVIPEQGIAAIYGPSGSAKTFLALDMVLSISKGLPWFDHRTTPCPVVYACLEGEAGLSIRLAAYRSKAGIGREVHFITQPINLLTTLDVRDLVAAILEYRAIDGLVIIDTLNRASPGMDENSSADMGKVVSAAKQIQQAVGGLVLLVHHTGKDATKGMRGHSSLFAALDAAVEVKRSGELRDWCVAKAKDGEDGKSHPFKLEIVELYEDDEGELVSSCVIRPIEGGTGQRMKPLTPAQQLGMNTFMAVALKYFGSGDQRMRAHIDQWRTEYFESSTAETQGGKRSAFSRVRNELIQLGKLVVQGDIYSLPVGFSAIASGESEASQ